MPLRREQNLLPLDIDLGDIYRSVFSERRADLAELKLKKVDYKPDQTAYEIPSTEWDEKYFSSVNRANHIAYLKFFKPWVKDFVTNVDHTAILPETTALMMPEKAWEKLRDTIISVRDNYPLVSDEIHSQLESDLQDESWEKNERKRFRQFIKENLEPYYEDKFTREGQPVWEIVEQVLDEDGAIDDIFYKVREHGPGDEWHEESDGEQALSHYFYKNIDFDEVKKIVDEHLFPENKRQMKFPFADEVVEALLNEKGFGKTGDCSVAALALAASLLESHDYSCVLARLPKDLADDILAWSQQQIPEQSLFVDEDKKGREDEIHVTVKYGLSNPMPSEDLKRLFIETTPFEVSLAPISLFRNGKYDVVKLDVASPQLHEFNRRVTEATPCPGNTFPEYHPHVTLAYVKPGTCDRLEGMSPWDSQVKMGVSDIGQDGKFEVDQVVFSSSVGVKKLFSLGPKKEPEEVEESEEAGLVDPRELAHKACLFGRKRTLRWMRKHVGRRVVTRVEIRRIKPGTIWHEGDLRICFDRGEAAQTTFCSYELLKMSIRQWRNLYGAELYVDGQPAGKVSCANPALADAPYPPR